MRRLQSVLPALLLGTLAAAACDTPPPTTTPAALSLDAELRQAMGMWGPMPIGPMAAQPSAQVALGRALFFDKILSGNRDVACSTCHSPSHALGDGRSLPIGTGALGSGAARVLGEGRQPVARTAPSLLNSGLGAFLMFWDGRLMGAGNHVVLHGNSAFPTAVPNLLSAQAMLAVLDRREMRGETGDRDVFGNVNELAEFGDNQQVAVWDALMRRLLEVPQYREMVQAAYPGAALSQLGFVHAARALTAFQMEAFTHTRTPFDRYLARDDAALTTQQKRGGLLFFGQARCATCHSGPLLGAQQFANVGVPQIGPGMRREPPLDLGRGELENHDFYRFAFRVAPLRNVELTAPYMHNGAYRTLEDVVRHYNDVPRALRGYDPAAHLAPEMRGLHRGDDATVNRVLATLDHRLRTPLGLSEADIADLVAFLKALTDPGARDLGALRPASVPSGLPVDP
jgi:cytochrome c peroxidase